MNCRLDGEAYDFTAGLAYQYSRRLGLEFAAMYAKSNPVRGKNPLSNTEATALDLVLDAPSNQTAFGVDANDQDILLDMHQWEITMGISLRFD
ncbi:hypothetical protein [Sinimarinibacterium thermocellulolyticum]|uniref:Uncharacterized protein n=1 Tax=Sinimarinibacterium thermocellulolyticum TaxID=3170016 RepID=A0ABV2AE84_9GAMM